MKKLNWIDRSSGGNPWEPKSIAATEIGEFKVIRYPKQPSHFVRFKGFPISRQVHKFIADAKAEAQQFYDEKTK